MRGPLARGTEFRWKAGRASIVSLWISRTFSMQLKR